MRGETFELRWFTRKAKREDYTEKEWRELQAAHQDPEPRLPMVRTLQWRIAGGPWRDVREEDDTWGYE